MESKLNIHYKLMASIKLSDLKGTYPGYREFVKEHNITNNIVITKMLKFLNIKAKAVTVFPTNSSVQFDIVKLNNMEYLDLPRPIGTMFQTGKFVNGTPITREHPRSVPGTGRDEGRTYSGVTIPLDYWRKMLVEFNQGSSSSANREEYSMGGLKDESRSEGTWIMASFIYDSDWHNSKVAHQLVINYRGPKGEFSSYIGNVEDFFNQVLEFVKTITKRKEVIVTSNKFGLGDGDTTMANLLKNVSGSSFTTKEFEDAK